jgi:hypothetical protein
MQLFSNHRLRALALTTALLTLLSLADALSQGPISYLSGTPNLTVSYSWVPNCDATLECISSDLLAGACCMSNFQSQSLLSFSD